MDILEAICGERRADVEQARSAVPVPLLDEQASTRIHHSLVRLLEDRSGTRIVAEVKKASPSAGILREDYQPGEIAATYEACGAAAVSVLTEPLHFQGCGEHLRSVRSRVEMPVLRKDFICDSYQVSQAAAWGADVVLLIVAALDADSLRLLYDEALRYGLEVLVEAHTQDELVQALKLENAIVGVNSRNLKTLKTDLSTARQLAAMIPEGRVAIAESGIRFRAEIEELERLGYRGFLIGETLMSAADPGGKLRELLGK